MIIKSLVFRCQCGSGHFQNTDLNNKIIRLSVGALEDGAAKHIRDWEYNNISIATREG